jgi:hypothetical protein
MFCDKPTRYRERFCTFVWNFRWHSACHQPDELLSLPASNRYFLFFEENRVMIFTKLHRVIFLALCCVLFTMAPAAFAQDSSQPGRSALAREDETNLDTQLYLILATNRETEDGRMPVALDSVMKRLHESLTFKHYSLAGTFVNRVRNGGRIDVSWVGGSLLVPTNGMTANPSFSQFTALVKLSADLGGLEVVRMNDFRFGARVPIVTSASGMTTTSTNAALLQSVNYEPIGLRTDISMREGSAVIAGTLNMGPSGDTIVVVVAARRSSN